MSSDASDIGLNPENSQFPSRESAESSVLKELTFQLAITRAMLKTVEIDQILYIILSGITHGGGLNFNRAVLFLAWDRRNEVRVSRSAGPANGEEAHRIWEGIKAERLNLESLFEKLIDGLLRSNHFEAHVTPTFYIGAGIGGSLSP